MQHQLASARLAAVLEQKDVQVTAEYEPSTGHWNRQMGLGQGALNMSQNVVRSLGDMM